MEGRGWCGTYTKDPCKNLQLEFIIGVWYVYLEKTCLGAKDSMEEEKEEEKPILQEIEDEKEKWISRISLWISLILTTAVVLWYYQATPPDSPEVIKMRVFFNDKNQEVMKFIKMTRNEQIAYAYRSKHPFYKSYIKASTVEQERIRSLAHISTDYTPNQYWFNLFFMWVILFTTFWFLGLMGEACIVLMRRNSEARIKTYRREREEEERLASEKKESSEE